MRDLKSVGFIGLGVMGEAMCRNLVRCGRWPVHVHDLDPAPVERLVADGGIAAASAAEVAEASDIVLLCLPGGDQVRELALNEGLLKRMTGGQALVDMSTSPPGLMRDINSTAAERGVWFADAPVARTRAAAVDGTLAIMVGADKSVFDVIEPVLATMGSDILHCGDVGAGQVVKILNNMVVFETVAAVSEAVSIAEAQGVGGDVLLDMMSKGSGDSFVLRNHGRRSIVPEAYPERAFSVRYAQKDLSCALGMAADGGIRAPGADSLNQLFGEAIEAGDGDRYFPVIRKLLSRNAGS